MAKYILTPVDMDVENRITRVGIMDVSTKQYMGALYIKVLDESDKDWIEYNKVKDKFIDDLREGKADSKTNYKDLAKQIYEKIDLEIYKTKKKREVVIISEHPNLTNKEISIIGTYLDMYINKEIIY